MKRGEGLERREKFCKLALCEPKKAAAQLKDLATGLENCRNTADTIRALQEICFVGERTLWNDLKR